MGKLTHTVSGNPVSFKSADKSNIESLKVYFDPIQMGVGNPSPSNIKTIYGWNSIKYFQAHNIISIKPTNFSPIELNGGTIDYLENNTFFLSGTTTGNTTFTIPIESFIFKKNQTYTTIIIIETQGSQISGIPSVGIGFKYNSTAYFSMTLTPLDQPINTWNHSHTWSRENQEINTLTITLRTGWSNAKIKIFTSEESISENTASFDSAIYGGYVDLISGNIYNSYGKVIIDGSQTIIEQETSATYNLKIFAISRKNLYPDKLPRGNMYIYSDQLFRDTGAVTLTSSSQPWTFWVNASSYKFYFVAPYSYTLTSIAEYLSEHPITLFYAAQDVLVGQLNSQELKTFVGQNNIWSNTNDKIEITYEFTDHMAKRRLELNTPHIETLSGSLITFNTDMQAPLKTAKFYFTPIQAGSGDPSPENVRGINGWTGLNIHQEGRNLINTSELVGTDKVWWKGSVVTGYPEHYVTPLIAVKPGASYYLYRRSVNSSGQSGQGYVNYFGEDGITYLGQENWQDLGAGNPHIIPDDVYYIGITIGASYLDTAILQIAGQNTNYTTFIAGQIIPITFPIGTIYGGYLDLIAGKLVQTHCKVTFDGTEVIANTFAAPGDKFIRIYFFSSNNNKILHAKRFANQRPETCAYSHGKYETSNTIDVSKGGAVINNSGTTTYIILHLPIELYVSDKVSTDIHNYLANQYNNGTPVEICYELNTPIEYQLTPQQIKTLKGDNNIWSNANGVVDIKYWTH